MTANVSVYTYTPLYSRPSTSLAELSLIIQVIFVCINISAAFRNHNVVSRTCLHRVYLLLNVELEYTLSYILQNFYQNAGGEHTSMRFWMRWVSVTWRNRLPWVDITIGYLLRHVLNLRVAYVGLRVEITYSAFWPLLHCPLPQIQRPHRSSRKLCTKLTLP